jgi:TonB family protein
MRMFGALLCMQIFLLSAPAIGEPTDETRPTAAGPMHICGAAHYPIEALREQAEGSVELSFHVTIQGTVSDVTVETSSGNTYLDQAAVACASAWLYHPATKNGVPVEVPWTAMINFSTHPKPPPEVYRLSVEAVKKCAREPAPDPVELDKAARPTVLGFQFGEGTLTNVVLQSPSGSQILDQRALSCLQNLPADIVTKGNKEGFLMSLFWQAYRDW